MENPANLSSTLVLWSLSSLPSSKDGYALYLFFLFSSGVLACILHRHTFELISSSFTFSLTSIFSSLYLPLLEYELIVHILAPSFLGFAHHFRYSPFPDRILLAGFSNTLFATYLPLTASHPSNSWITPIHFHIWTCLSWFLARQVGLEPFAVLSHLIRMALGWKVLVIHLSLLSNLVLSWFGFTRAWRDGRCETGWRRKISLVYGIVVVYWGISSFYLRVCLDCMPLVVCKGWMGLICIACVGAVLLLAACWIYLFIFLLRDCYGEHGEIQKKHEESSQRKSISA
ncbi:hypothetical protein VTL71DRAFT_9705 [Oculimacula yallundae]|uniref:Transmembrane protein n=1 Tax=Oculimacula yallundae TaxID=86028 RepID=A0ABR4BRM6_9HELO